MDSKTALEILSLKDEATKDEIVKRYEILLKRKRLEPENKDLETLDNINMAYDVLMGYKPEVEEIVVDTDNGIWGVFGLEKKKVNNFFYYYKFHILAIILAVVVLVYTMVSCFSRVTPDLNIGVVGNFYMPDNSAVEELFQKKYSLKAVSVDSAISNKNSDAQYLNAIMQKEVLLFAAQEIDLFILDKTTFQKYAASGAFERLDTMKSISSKKGIEELYVDTNKKTKDKPYYGLDLSKKKLADVKLLAGNEYILAIGVSSKHKELAVSILNKILGG